MSERLKMVLVGDVYVQRTDFRIQLSYASEAAEAANIAFGNIETVVADLEHLGHLEQDHEPTSG